MTMLTSAPSKHDPRDVEPSRQHHDAAERAVGLSRARRDQLIHGALCCRVAEPDRSRIDLLQPLDAETMTAWKVDKAVPI
jgi:hypothetical protein